MYLGFCGFCSVQWVNGMIFFASKCGCTEIKLGFILELLNYFLVCLADKCYFKFKIS